MKKIRYLLLGLLSLSLVSCGASPSVDNVKSISVSPDAVSLVENGESKSVRVKIEAIDNKKPFDKGFEMSIEDKSIAKAECDNPISGQTIKISPLKEGKTTLTVTSKEGKKTTSVSINVEKSVIPPDPTKSKVNVYLVLGENGLYEGKKGEDFEKPQWIENAIKYYAEVGSLLPGKDKVTSTIENVVFDCWQRGKEGVGAPTKYTNVPDESGVILYASYISVENPNPGPGPDPIDDPDEGITIYFTNNKGWDKVCYYVWSMNGDEAIKKEIWPGLEMEFVTKNGFGEDIYKAYVEAIYDFIIFNNGDNGQQSEDISLEGIVNNSQFYLEGSSSPYQAIRIDYQG